MVFVNWILGKLVDLINWMADREEGKSRMQDIPSASPQGPEDGPRWRVESMGYESGPGWDAFVVNLTPDRPIDPYMEQVREEARALTGKAEAVNYPRGQ